MNETQREKKLGALKAAIAKARASLIVLAERKKKAGTKQVAALYEFQIKRHKTEQQLKREQQQLAREQRRVLKKLGQKERRLNRAINKAASPAKNAYWRQHTAVENLRYKIQNIEWEVREKNRLAVLSGPLTPSELTEVERRLKANGRPIEDGKTIVFKRVSRDNKTQVGTYRETTYPIGKIVEVDNWNPRNQECGGGKLHACYSPMNCNGFFVHTRPDDKYIAIEVELKDMYAWPNPDYPGKIAFRKGKVLYVCDENGKKKRDRKKQAVD